jgi:predicted nuclease of predicted toxin-antitoxin system
MGKTQASTREQAQRDLMRFLIDECLHTSLVGLAHDAGHLCDHVNFLGLSGLKDWQLMDTIRAGDYTFVTNNASDFSALYIREQFHAGLVIIVPNVTPARQRDLFRAVLAHTGGRDLINAVVEVDITAGTIICWEYLYPVN